MQTREYAALTEICADAVDSMRQWARSPSALKAINNRIGAYEKVATDVFSVTPEQFSADICKHLGKRFRKAADE